MDKIKLKLTASEFRVLHDLIAYLLVLINREIKVVGIEGILRVKLDFIILQRVVQKKMAAKVVFLQKTNNLSLTYDEAIVLHERISEIEVSAFDDFTGALICSIFSDIEPKLFSHVSIHGKEPGHEVFPHQGNEETLEVLPAG